MADILGISQVLHFPPGEKDHEAAPERDGPFFLILFTHMGSGPADVGGEIRIFIIKDILIVTIDDHGVLIMVDSLVLSTVAHMDMAVDKIFGLIFFQ